MSVCHRARDITVNCTDGDSTFCGRAPARSTLESEVAPAAEFNVFIPPCERETQRGSLSDISLYSWKGTEQHGKRRRHGGGGRSLLVAGEREGRV